MNPLNRKLIFITLLAVTLSAASVFAARMEGIAGKMISVDPELSRINVKVEVPGLLGPAMRDVTFDVDPDAKWYVCFGGSCVEKRGSEGAQMVMEYTPYEPYGLRVEGCNTALVKSGNVITEIWFEIC